MLSKISWIYADENDVPFVDVGSWKIGYSFLVTATAIGLASICSTINESILAMILIFDKV